MQRHLIVCCSHEVSGLQLMQMLELCPPPQEKMPDMLEDATLWTDASQLLKQCFGSNKLMWHTRRMYQNFTVFPSAAKVLRFLTDGVQEDSQRDEHERVGTDLIASLAAQEAASSLLFALKVFLSLSNSSKVATSFCSFLRLLNLDLATCLLDVIMSTSAYMAIGEQCCYFSFQESYLAFCALAKADLRTGICWALTCRSCMADQYFQPDLRDQARQAHGHTHTMSLPDLHQQVALTASHTSSQTGGLDSIPFPSAVGVPLMPLKRFEACLGGTSFVFADGTIRPPEFWEPYLFCNSDYSS